MVNLDGIQYPIYIGLGAVAALKERPDAGN